MRLPASLFISIALLLFIEYYCYTAIHLAIRNNSKLTKIIVYSAYLVVSLFVLLSMLTFRRVDFDAWPDAVRVFVIALMMGVVVGKLIMASFMLIDDLRRLFTWLFQKVPTIWAKPSDKPAPTVSISRSTFIANVAIVTGGLFLGAFLWGTRNRYRYQVNKVKLKVANLPEAFKGLKIVQLSDIHVGSFDQAAAVAEGIDLVMQQEADLILFTGDLVNNEATELNEYKSIFSRLKAPLGVYSILGNHDYGDYKTWPSAAAKVQNLEALKTHQADMGWTLLLNEHVIIEKDQQQLALLGVENWSASSRFPKHGRLDKAYAGLEGKQIPKILMTHDPSHWESEVKNRYKDIDLTLSGHTHGMQFGVGIPGLKWSPAQFIYKQWGGLYQAAKQKLYVNVGFGFIGYPGRLGILPEITVLELQ